jgi:hypothetical protein
LGAYTLTGSTVLGYYGKLYGENKNRVYLVQKDDGSYIWVRQYDLN